MNDNYFTIEEAMFHFLSESDNFDMFCRANIEKEVSIYEWVKQNKREEFERFCRNNFNLIIALV